MSHLDEEKLERFKNALISEGLDIKDFDDGSMTICINGVNWNLWAESFDLYSAAGFQIDIINESGEVIKEASKVMK
mgnify:CR=1 FL=1